MFGKLKLHIPYPNLKKVVTFFMFFGCLFSSLKAQNLACDCKDYLYVNDESENLIHKFSLDNTDGSLSEIGSPWLPASAGITAPHGIIPDLNGFLYITGGATDGDMVRLDCDGNIILNPFLDNQNQSLGIEVRTTNYISKNGILYIMENANRAEILAVDLCDGSLVGSMQIDGGANRGPLWDINTDGTNWYVTSRGENAMYSGILDLNLFTTPATNTGSKLFDLQYGRPMGFTLDDSGNFYVVEDQNFTGSLNTPNIVKYNSSGTYMSDIEENTTANTANTANGEAGWWGVRGIAYSSQTGLLYAGSKENCVTVFDTNLNELSALNLGNPVDGDPKAVAIVPECCPLFETAEIEQSFCEINTGEDVFLIDFLPCEFICAGEWSVISNTAGTFNACDNSFTYEQAGDGCFSYDYVPNPSNPNTICEEFHIEICVTFGDPTVVAAPVIDVTDNVCTPASDGSFDIVTPCSADAHIEWSIDGGNTWSADTPIYDTNTAMSVVARCVTNATGCASPNSNSVTTAPTTNCPCSITPTTTVLACQNAGTASDASDDIFDVTVNASATNGGATGQFTVSNGATILGTYDYDTGGTITGLPADGTTITLTFADIDDNACSANVDVSQTSCECQPTRCMQVTLTKN